MQVKYYNSGNNQWESANPLPPEEIYIGDTPPAQGINAKLWLDTSVTGLLPASYAVADNCEQTVAGQAVLDAHQGYLLQNQINNLSEDFIVEQGTSGIWTYRKWNSGIAECWGILSATVTGWVTWGNLYEGTSDTRYALFPTRLFNSAPICTVSYNGGGSGAFLETYLAPTIERTATYIPLRPNAGSSPSTFNITIHAKGTWK